MDFIMDYIDTFLIMWTDDFSALWWEMLLLALAFFVGDLVLFWAMWFMRQEVAIECGYPGRKNKTMKKRISKHSLWDRILLFRLTYEAERKGIMLYLNLLCHCLNLLALVGSFVGFIGCMVTLGDGWAFALLVMSEFLVFAATFVIEFIPHLIWLKSARDKYR